MNILLEDMDLDELGNAASSWIAGETKPMITFIDYISKNSFLDGYNHATKSQKGNGRRKKCNNSKTSCSTLDTTATVKKFVEDVLPKMQWECLQYRTAFNLYVGWLQDKNINVKPKYHAFTQGLRDVVNPKVHGWFCQDSPSRILNRQDGIEPLLAQYNVTKYSKTSHTRGLFKI